MEYKAYSKDYVDGLNLNFDYDVLEKYNLATAHEINNNYVNLYSSYKNYLDQYIYNYLSQIDISSVELTYGIRFDKMPIEDYQKLISAYNTRNSTELSRIIIGTYSTLVEYNGANQIGIQYNDSKLKTMLERASKEIKTEFKLVEVHDTQSAVNLDNIQADMEEMKKYPKYIQIGSIVNIKKDFNKYMIIGYMPVTPEGTKYDYLVCLYPAGVVRTDFNLLINHDDIRKILFLGLIDDEQQDFMQKMNAYIQNEEV